MARILQAFLHRLSENTKTAITFFFFKLMVFFKLIFFFLNSGRARVNRAGRKPVRAGRSALGNRPAGTLCIVTASYLFAMFQSGRHYLLICHVAQWLMWPVFVGCCSGGGVAEKTTDKTKTKTAATAATTTAATTAATAATTILVSLPWPTSRWRKQR